MLTGNYAQSVKPHSNSETIPFSIYPVPAGEPLENFAEMDGLDINNYLTGGKDGFYVIRVFGDSMVDRIKSGDFVVVNTNAQANSGDVVVAKINGGFTVKIFKPTSNGLCLIAANGKFKSHNLTKDDEVEIFGVVTWCFGKV